MAEYSVACIVTPGHGHVNPVLPIVEELTKAGLRVLCPTTERFAPAFAGVGAEPSLYDDVYLDEKPLKACSTDKLSELFVTSYIDESIAAFDNIVAQMESNPPRLILHNAVSIVGRMLATKLQTRSMQIYDSFADNDAFSVTRFLLNLNDPNMLEGDRKLTAALVARGISRAAYDDRKHIQRLVFTSRFFQYEGQTFDQSYHFVGPCLRSGDHEADWQPPKGSSKPIVLISLGTVFTDALPFFQLCLDAFAHSEWHVVMSVGRFIGREQFKNIPDNVEVHAYVPQLAVLRHAQVFISHAGMNSTMESLYHGVPMVLIPQMPEQEMVAKRVVHFGLGKLLPRDEVTTAALLHAANSLLRDPYLEMALQRMRELLRLAGGAPEAARQILALIHEDQLMSALPAYAEA